MRTKHIVEAYVSSFQRMSHSRDPCRVLAGSFSSHAAVTHDYAWQGKRAMVFGDGAATQLEITSRSTPSLDATAGDTQRKDVA